MGVDGKYLTFRLGHESYGLPVLKVREIIRLPDITSVPRMPNYVMGVINLRGKVVPVVDLRVKFLLSKAELTERTCVVVTQVELHSKDKALMGLIVDAVEEVLSVPENEIEPPPDFGSKLSVDYLVGMAKIRGSVKTLLDIDKIMAGEIDLPGMN
jgi:purine-binding chemotaxis protein CheW